MMEYVLVNALTVIIVLSEEVMPSVMSLLTLSVSTVTQILTSVSKDVRLTPTVLVITLYVVLITSVAAHQLLTVKEVLGLSVMFPAIHPVLTVTWEMANVNLDVMKILTVLLSSPHVTHPATLAAALTVTSAQEVMLSVMWPPIKTATFVMHRMPSASLGVQLMTTVLLTSPCVEQTTSVAAPAMMTVSSVMESVMWTMSLTTAPVTTVTCLGLSVNQDVGMIPTALHHTFVTAWVITVSLMVNVMNSGPVKMRPLLFVMLNTALVHTVTWDLNLVFQVVSMIQSVLGLEITTCVAPLIPVPLWASLGSSTSLYLPILVMVVLLQQTLTLLREESS